MTIFFPNDEAQKFSGAAELAEAYIRIWEERNHLSSRVRELSQQNDSRVHAAAIYEIGRGSREAQASEINIQMAVLKTKLSIMGVEPE